jgi:hypothetical protein
VNLRTELSIQSVFLHVQVAVPKLLWMQFRSEECTTDTEIGEFTQTPFVLWFLISLLFDIVTAGVE